MGTGDMLSKYLMRNIMVTVTTTKAPPAGGSWTNRVYYIDLPADYTPSKPYPILFGGTGCGGAPNTNGSSGGFPVLPTNNMQAIQIGLSYVNNCFQPGRRRQPRAAVLRRGPERGRGELLRRQGQGVRRRLQQRRLARVYAGLRARRRRSRHLDRGGRNCQRDGPAADTKLPVAGLLLTGADDNTNPAAGPTGSDVAMNLLLTYNGCKGTDTVPWETACPGCACIRYTGCPAGVPGRPLPSAQPGHTDGGGASRRHLADLMTLPTP